MTGAELRHRRAALGLSGLALHREAMRILGQPALPQSSARAQVSRWENDMSAVPIWMPLILQIIERSREKS